MLVEDLLNTDTHHFVDDDYDELEVWELAWAKMTQDQKSRYMDRQALEDRALDAYNRVLNETGDIIAARKAYHQTFNK